LVAPEGSALAAATLNAATVSAAGKECIEKVDGEKLAVHLLGSLKFVETI